MVVLVLQVRAGQVQCTISATSIVAKTSTLRLAQCRVMLSSHTSLLLVLGFAGTLLLCALHRALCKVCLSPTAALAHPLAPRSSLGSESGCSCRRGRSSSTTAFSHGRSCSMSCLSPS